MRLSNQEIINILAQKNLKCLNIQDYKNMDTILQLECNNGHKIEASLKTVRNTHFQCLICEGINSSSQKLNLIEPPEKTGYRIVALDNATEKAGVSIFDDGKLVYYTLIQLHGETIQRLAQNRKILQETIIEQWKPDLLIFEDIQYQNNIYTFKVLAMLLGSSVVTAHLAGVKYETVLSKVWREHYCVTGKTRVQQKAQSIQKVKEMYGINVGDDEAEAILLGKYAVDKRNEVKPQKLF